MKLLILILATKQNPWKRILREGVYKTWASKSYDNVQIVSYYGNNDKQEEKNGDLLLTSHCKNYIKKTLEAFEYSLENYEFDYILRTNISTYVRVDELYKFLSNKPREKYYAGIPHTIKNALSGTGMIYSKDIIKIFVDNINSINTGIEYPDDLVLSQFLYERKINIIDFIESKFILNYEMEYLEKNPKEELKKFIFFRCKTELKNNKWTDRNGEYRNDPEKMKYLHNIWAKGQINRNSKLGESIYKLSKRSDVKTILDIGTGNGMGSTKCICDGVAGTNKRVYSIECNKERHEEAKKNLGILPKNFNLIHGTIIDDKELFPTLEVLRDKKINGWFKEDLKWIKDAPNIFSQLPEKIDLCIMDGGEFSGYIEFLKLWKRCRFIVLDDTNMNKHKKTREFILDNLDKFTIIDDNTEERNGFLICENGLY